MEVKLETEVSVDELTPDRGPEERRCRCCYSVVSDNCKRLMEQCNSDGVDVVYSRLLRETFSITLSSGDCEYICEECVVRLLDASGFRRLVLDTELRFTRHSRPAAVAEMTVKLEVQDEDEEVTWDIDYLEPEDDMDDPISPNVELKVEKERHKTAPMAAVFTPAPVKVDHAVERKAQPTKRALMTNLAKLLTSNAAAKPHGRPLNKAFTSNTLRALAGKPLSTTRSSGATRAAVALSSAHKAASVTGKLLSVTKSCMLASKLLRSKGADDPRAAQAKAISLGAKLNVDSILKALNFRPKAVPPQRSSIRRVAKEAPASLFRSEVCDKRLERQIVKQNVVLLLKHTTIVAFISYRGNFRCFYCGSSSFNFEDLRKHTNEAHSDVDKAVRRVHCFKDIVHVDISSLTCRRCSRTCPDVETMKEHLIAEHRVKINTKHKDDVIPFKLNGTEYKCHLCPEEFHVFRNLSVHMNVHFPNYMCEVCGKAFASARRCASHEDTHRKGTFPCSKCDRVFESTNSRNAHSLEHRETKYRCPQCPERFEKYLQRTLHMSEVHGVTRTFRCPHPDCGREFIHRPQMAAHSRSHAVKEKKVACTDCGMRFHNNYALRKHLVSHTGERPFLCKVCGKKYGRKNTLREHMRIHDNDRRHVCAECGQGFVQKCSLKGHMKSRHPNAVMF